ncbi:hypothetical protein BFJ66_g3931 [Fusarium oxysporum f. sp. cepae]|nr:hypothetical protein BFJ67_g9006 [Fusarium oxysporum f. sp. cepae]RKK55980.1 hypothetical protein BFJ66_g3931 [Fusarium oxysporum f. sp. cepae]
MTYTGVLFLNYALFERVEVNSNFFQQFNFTDSTNNYVYAEHTRKTITKVIFSSKVIRQALQVLDFTNNHVFSTPSWTHIYQDKQLQPPRQYDPPAIVLIIG